MKKRRKEKKRIYVKRKSNKEVIAGEGYEVNKSSRFKGRYTK